MSLLLVNVLNEYYTCSVLLVCNQGMVEPGDTVSATLKKEFGEEAMDTLQMDQEKKKKTEEAISNLFKGGEKVGNP